MGKGGFLCVNSSDGKCDKDGAVYVANTGLVAIPNDTAAKSVTYHEWGSYINNAQISAQHTYDDAVDTNNNVWQEACGRSSMRRS